MLYACSSVCFYVESGKVALGTGGVVRFEASIRGFNTRTTETVFENI
jgi:hypothetical protein